jgi:glycosyltransferase involved in cell wall biosynthesis
MPDAVIVNSHAGRCFHQRIGYSPRRWQYLPNGFDTGELQPNLEARRHLRATLAIDDDTIAIGLPARYHPMKDHRTFLAAAAILAATPRQVCFVLAGAGIEPTNRALAKAIAEHGIGGRVRLLGERSDMAAIYAVLDIATLSSAYGEGFSNVLGEAMACGVPCVATDVGDAADLIGPTGMVVQPRDPRALAAAWEALIALGPQGLRSRGREARERIIRDYNLGSIVACYESLYEEIAAQMLHPPDVKSRNLRPISPEMIPGLQKLRDEFRQISAGKQVGVDPRHGRSRAIRFSVADQKASGAIDRPAPQ